MTYLFVAITILGITGGQLLLKKGLAEISFIPNRISEFLPFFLRAFTNIYIILAVVCVGIAACSWLVALSKTNLGQIYPITAINFILVPLLSVAIFRESIPMVGWIGIVLVVVGIALLNYVKVN
jgi:multidrug transporter EmrE-like cation transporter